MKHLCDAIERTAKELFGDDLKGYCFLCSVVLATELNRRGTFAIVHCGHVKFDREDSVADIILPHAWVEVGEEVHDPTVCQFAPARNLKYINGKPIPPERYKRYFTRGLGKKQADALAKAVACKKV